MGSFVVYGVTRKLAHDLAVKEIEAESKRTGKQIGFQLLQEKLRQLEPHIYATAKPCAISPWYDNPLAAIHFVRLAKEQDGGRDLQIKQRVAVLDGNGQPQMNNRNKPITEIIDYRC